MENISKGYIETSSIIIDDDDEFLFEVIFDIEFSNMAILNLVRIKKVALVVLEKNCHLDFATPIVSVLKPDRHVGIC